MKYIISKLARSARKLMKGIRSTLLASRFRKRPFTELYAAIMNQSARSDPYHAVGGQYDNKGRSLGKLQLDFFMDMGLTPMHKLLDIGCGCLRAGEYFIDYLDTGNYAGMDISEEVLAAGMLLLADKELSPKRPHILINRNLKFNEFVGMKFDYLNAHSVFTHLPIVHVEECLANVGKVMHSESIFFATYYQGEYSERRIYPADPYLRFSYPLKTLQDIGKKYGLRIGEVERDLGNTPDYHCLRITLEPQNPVRQQNQDE